MKTWLVILMMAWFMKSEALDVDAILKKELHAEQENTMLVDSKLDWPKIRSISARLVSAADKRDSLAFHDAFEELLDEAKGTFGRDTYYVGVQVGKGYGSVVAGKTEFIRDSAVDMPFAALTQHMTSSPQLYLGELPTQVAYLDANMEVTEAIPKGIPFLDTLIYPDPGSRFMYRLEVGENQLWRTVPSEEEGCKLYSGMAKIVSEFVDKRNERRLLLLPMSMFCKDNGYPVFKLEGVNRKVGHKNVLTFKLKAFVDKTKVYPALSELDGFSAEVAKRLQLKEEKLTAAQLLEKAGLTPDQIKAVYEEVAQKKQQAEEKSCGAEGDATCAKDQKPVFPQ